MTGKLDIKLIECGNTRFGILQQEVIGEGASAVVKKAINLDKPGTLYAVKIIKMTSQESRDVALRELEVSVELGSNPNLVRMEKVKVESANHIYIFMEYCEGGTLLNKTRIRTKPLEQQQLSRLFVQLINGYDALYKAHILHEDLKPENILINCGTYKISDFGLALNADNQLYGSKRRGTLYYMPYDKLVKKDFVATAKSDIYSLGVLLYECVTGRHPYVEKRGLGFKEYIKQLKEGKLRQDSRMLSRFSFRFMTIFELIKKMVAKLEEKRIGWEELHASVKSMDWLNQFLTSPAVEQSQNTGSHPAGFNIVQVSQANINNLELSFHEEVTEITDPDKNKQDKQQEQNKNPVQEQGEAQNAQKVQENIERILETKRMICLMLSRMIRHLAEYTETRKSLQLDIALLDLYLARPQIITPLEQLEIQPPQRTKVVEMYNQDCLFIKQQVMQFLAQSIIAQKYKKQERNRFKHMNEEQTLSSLADRIKCLFKESFLALRVNHKKQMILIFLLMNFMNLMETQKIQVEDMVAKVLDEEQKPWPVLRAWVLQKANKMPVLVDPDEDPVDSDEQFQFIQG